MAVASYEDVLTSADTDAAVDTCSQKGPPLSAACPPRGPFEPSPRRIGGASGGSEYAGPFEQGNQPSVDSGPRRAGSRPSGAWGTGVVVASCEDVLTSADTEQLQPLRTVAWEGQPASVVVESCAAGVPGGRPDPETSFAAAELQP